VIRREDVADLRRGDVVELRDSRWGGVTITGAVRETALGPYVGPLIIAKKDGSDPFDPDGPVDRTLTVVSRAPRPLYVNHPRTKPVPGDVVRDADDDSDVETWNTTGPSWFDRYGYGLSRSDLPDRLRLLVDGETGDTVPVTS
jgi:hypothetical protein